MNHFETDAIRTQNNRSENKEHSTPLYLTSSFIFSSADEMRAAFNEEIEHDIYSRYSNPSVSELVDKICKLEGTEDGYATASGMAAIFSTFGALCKSGDHILSIGSIFGATHTMFMKILPKWGISTTYVSCTKTSEWEKGLTPATKFLYIETPTNPGLELVDLEFAGNFAKKNNLILIVDNCFASPWLQQPAKYGAHLVVHSATKYIDGQGRVLGGLITGKKDLVHEIYLFCRTTGPSMSAFNAWVLSKSLETLAVRMDRHCSSALKIAGVLQNNAHLNFVKYPMLPSHPQHEIAKKQMKAGGGIIAFEVKGGQERARKFINALKMLSISANLGDTRSIVTHPASSTHAKLTEDERLAVAITQGLIRVSIGLEHDEDILQDIEQALEISK